MLASDLTAFQLFGLMTAALAWFYVAAIYIKIDREGWPMHMDIFYWIAGLAVLAPPVLTGAAVLMSKIPHP